MAVKKDSPLATVAKILGIVIACGAIATGVIGWLGTYAYATKGEVATIRRQIPLREYRIQKLEVDVLNTHNLVQRTDTNIEKILTRQGIAPAPAPIVVPPPPLPTVE